MQSQDAQTKIKDVMSTEFKIVSPDISLKDAACCMRDGDYGYLPVGENDRLTGTLTDRDIVIRGVAEGMDPDTPIRQVISENVIYCYDDDNVQDAAKLMERHQIRRLVILNRSKRVCGILTVGDIARCCGDDKLTGKIETGIARTAPTAPQDLAHRG